MTPWLDDGDVRLYHGDALAVLAALPAESVQTCVTSPPYWGLRDYGTGEWDGGDPGCDHTPARIKGRFDYDISEKQASSAGTDDARWRDECPCGARRVDSQLGLEPTPDAYVAAMVAVFREVRRVLRPDGTCWLNLGDSYIAGQGGRQSAAGEMPAAPLYSAADPRRRDDVDTGSWAERDATAKMTPARGTTDLKPKDLAGIPWMVAFALRADGWYLRSDIVWSKPNPMPESVSDRPTKAHEYVFLLSKGPRYFYDADAIREPHEGPLHAPGNTAAENWREVRGANVGKGMSGHLAEPDRTWGNPAGRNARSVWTIPTQPTPEAHFATYPEELVRRCILAGTSEAGECSGCGAPWVRKIERVDTGRRQKMTDGWDTGEGGHGTIHRNGRERGEPGIPVMENRTVGWAPSCSCVLRGGAATTEGVGGPPLPAPEPRPQTVLDPFVGSGTTALVARRHGRHAIGIDLSLPYLEIAAKRTAQLSLLAEGPAA